MKPSPLGKMVSFSLLIACLFMSSFCWNVILPNDGTVSIHLAKRNGLMEPAIYFTIFVLAIGVLQLICNVKSYISKFVATDQQLRASTTSQPTKRDDWYMFFHRSDVTGKVHHTKKNDRINGTNYRQNPTHRRKQKTRRPQLHVS